MGRGKGRREVGNEKEVGGGWEKEEVGRGRDVEGNRGGRGVIFLFSQVECFCA